MGGGEDILVVKDPDLSDGLSEQISFDDDEGFIFFLFSFLGEMKQVGTKSTFLLL
jgi:hypothetical protein